MIFQLEKLLLILTRITSFIVIVPGYSFKGVPNLFKVGLSIAITAFAYTMTPEFTAYGALPVLALMILREVFLGLTLGFVCQMAFTAVEIAGGLIDFQAGFSMASVYDPSVGSQASHYGRTYYWISISVFFITNMHRVLMNAVIKSFAYVPLASPIMEGFGAQAILTIFYRMFELGINLAAPIIITMLLTDAVLGIISRAVPQINVFMLGMPMKAMISFMIFFASVPWIVRYSGRIIDMMPDYIDGILKLFAAG
ncbi:MAG: flagellar biosynthetic protein FliR [Gudongella sp.]|jgi:flagellar biosynthetic protein FliR|nr:flagellar biosynthetic protein FliR [Gudongella sp.]